MRFREIITELFDPKLAVDLEWAEGSDYVAARGYVTVTNPNGYGGEYGNEEEVELEIEFGEYPHPQRKEYEVQFKVDESFAITGGGNANVIFATVIQACKDFVEMYKPDRLFFTADEQSRARMYDTITKRVAKQVGWHVLPFDEIQKDPLYRHKSGNGFMFVIAKGEAPEKFQSSQKPQHGSFMPIWFVYNLDKDTPTVAVKVRAPSREAAVTHARKIEPSFRDLDSMQIHALSSLPKREVTDVIDGGTAGENQTVAEGAEHNNLTADKIFFARSNKTPKGWSYDHVGFITQDGKQIQMSGHKGNDVYITNSVTDDPEFPKQNIKIVSLSKPVSVPTTNSVGAENCGTFVANVLQANDIKGIDTQKIYSVFKQPQKQGVAENFADGKNPEDKGDSKRHGVPTKASVSTLRKVAKQGGRKGQLAHWMANMKAGKAKKS